VQIVCLQHVPFEGPAEIATWAAARGHALEVVPLYEPGHSHPPLADMLVVMGGPMSVHDEEEHAFLAPERRYIGAAVDAGAPVLGVCLGAQLLADVLGADVIRGEHVEIGWYPVSRTPAGDRCPVLGHLPQIMSVLHWHSDVFGIPSRAVHAYASEACQNQAFSFDGGRVVGLQFHLEQSPESLRELAEAAADDIVDGPWIQSVDTMLADPDLFKAANEALFTLLDAMSATRVTD
jgi:GMP synthase-like glutamine amidotransferase